MASRSCSNCPSGCCARSACNTRSTRTFSKIGGVMSMATAPSDNTSRSTTLPRKGRSKAHNRAVIRDRGGVFVSGRVSRGQPSRFRRRAPFSAPPASARKSWRQRALRRPTRSVNSRATSPGRRKTSIHCPSTCTCRKCEPTAGSTRKASICSQRHCRRRSGRRLPARVGSTVNCRSIDRQPLGTRVARQVNARVEHEYRSLFRDRHHLEILPRRQSISLGRLPRKALPSCVYPSPFLIGEAFLLVRCGRSCASKNEKSRRGRTPGGIRPRRLTRQRAPRQRRVALYLVIRQLRIDFWRSPAQTAIAPQHIIVWRAPGKARQRIANRVPASRPMLQFGPRPWVVPDMLPGGPTAVNRTICIPG